MEGRKAGAGQEWRARARRNRRAKPRESGWERSVAKVEVVRKGGGGRGAAGTGSRQRCEAEKSEGGGKDAGQAGVTCGGMGGKGEVAGAHEDEREDARGRPRRAGRGQERGGPATGRRRREGTRTKKRARNPSPAQKPKDLTARTRGARRTKRERMFHVKHSFPDEAQRQTKRVQGRMSAIGPNAETGPSEAIPPNRTQTEQIVKTSLCRKPSQSKRAEAWRRMIWGCRGVARRID